MAGSVDFYFDFSSPYGYFASERINALAAQYGRSVTWHPLALGVIFKSTGTGPLTTLPLKGVYSIHDIERTARFHGIDYRLPPTFPIATQIASRGMLWVQATHGEAAAVAFAQAIFRALFVDGVHVGEPEQVARIAASVGLDAAALIEAAGSDAIKQQFKENISAAMQRGVFGSPFIIVDDESFWGFDRFAQIESMLQHGSVQAR